jgi:hypothetical protein
MNIFVLDKNPQKAAQYHNDRHVVKMILESAQLLSTACRLSDVPCGYQITHVNHPCSQWTRESLSNWRWLKELAYYLNQEYKFRFKQSRDHRAYALIKELPEPDIPDRGLTKFVQAMPNQYQDQDVVKAYRCYYRQGKKHLGQWSNQVPPWW